MGSKYPVLTPKQITSALEKAGFAFIKQRGSHMKYQKGQYTVIVPNHSEVAKGTLKSILRLANMELDEFLKLL